MKFEDAIRMMREGKKVLRRSSHKVILEYTPTRNNYGLEIPAEIKHDGISYFLDAKSIMEADDWEDASKYVHVPSEPAEKAGTYTNENVGPGPAAEPAEPSEPVLEGVDVEESTEEGAVPEETAAEPDTAPAKPAKAKKETT